MSTPGPASSLPRSGVLVGVDHGLKRIGLAATDRQQTMAMPLLTLESKSSAHNQQQFLRVRDDYGVVGWVVGLPLHMSGDESPQSQIVRRFGAWLQQVTARPVVFCDERLSSSSAEAVLWSLGESPSRQKGRVDGLAAQAILDAYVRQCAADRAGEQGTSSPPLPAGDS